MDSNAASASASSAIDLLFSFALLERSSEASVKAILIGCEILLLVASIVVVIGLVGELRSEKWSPAPARVKYWHVAFIWMVILGVAGELIADGEIFLASHRLQSIQDVEVARLKKEAETARKETAELQKVTAWRKINDEQAAKIRAALAGKGAVCRLLILNRTDPESAQFLMKIVGFFNKIEGANCTVFFVDPTRPYPFAFPPTGVLSFVSDDAPENEKVFIEAFKEAGVVTQRVGIVGSQLFPSSVRSGLIIAAKPDALETFPWSTQTPQ